MNNMLIAQSGGPTAAINASLSGAIKRAMKHAEIDGIYGAFNGIMGVMEERFVDLRALMRSEEDFVRLKKTPAMALGSCRKRLSAQPDETYEKIRQIFLRHEIKYFFYIGGNDSMDTAGKLAEYFTSCGDDIRVVGIPKTIDNDLDCTDHTPGFGSAARYIATSVAEVAADSAIYFDPSVTIIEIMGRNAGWLTAAAALARREGCIAPHLICLPERVFDEDEFIEKIREIQKVHKQVIVAVSEGVRYADGRYVAAGSKPDPFGHYMLSGVGQVLKNLVDEKIGCKVRSVELNVLQRSAAHEQSETDVEEACRIGAEAVSLGVQGKTGVMATFKRIRNHPYLVTYSFEDISKIANVEKKVPMEWINGMDVTEDMLEYLRPLILNNSKKESGIPCYFTIPR